MNKMHEASKRIREASGSINSSSKLTAFLYLLMRNHVAPGIIEEIMREIHGTGPIWEFCNGWLALHAEDIKNRLVEGD